jgi:hypothetical protein
MTTLADLRAAAQSQADRVNGPSTTTEWNQWINASAAELYGRLTSLFDDYNVQTYNFTLSAGEPSYPGGLGNALQVGPGTGVPDFDKLRKLSVMLGTNGTTPVFTPVTRCNSLLERDKYTAPALNPYYGNIASAYLFYGNIIEVLPPQSAAGTYRLWYVPRFKALVQDQDSIDSTWMATNGIDEYIVLGAAIKQLIKEESLDTASILKGMQSEIGMRIEKEFAPRDDNQPGKIVDSKRLRNTWGFPGGGGPGWPA